MFILSSETITTFVLPLELALQNGAADYMCLTLSITQISKTSAKIDSPKLEAPEV